MTTLLKAIEDAGYQDTLSTLWDYCIDQQAQCAHEGMVREAKYWGERAIAVNDLIKRVV